MKELWTPRPSARDPASATWVPGSSTMLPGPGSPGMPGAGPALGLGQASTSGEERDLVDNITTIVRGMRRGGNRFVGGSLE